MVWLFIAYAVYVVWSNGDNSGGQAAHLGGAVVGALLIFNQELLNFAGGGGAIRFGGRRVIKDSSRDMDR